ncbi:MAG: Ig-like domain-containing protein [Actinomycetota bacterium]|nr:Ig-like domain-containing protein [Actinomycetota bacterium]
MLSSLGAALVVGRASASTYTITVSASPNPVPANATSVTLTATVSPPPSPPSSAYVTFYVNSVSASGLLSPSAYGAGCNGNGTVACVNSNGIATASYTGFAPGATETIYAKLRVSGSAPVTSAPLSLGVASDQPDSSSVALGSNGTTFTQGQQVLLSATVTDTATGQPVTSGTVQFVDDTSNAAPVNLGGPVSVDASGHCTLAWSSFSYGTHQIEAHFTGPTVANSSASGLTVTIVSPPSLPSTSTVMTVNPQAITTNGSATLVATVTNAYTGANVDGGTVTFYDVNTSLLSELGRATNVGNGQYVFTLQQQLAPGIQHIQANFTDLGVALASQGSATLTVLPSLASSSTALSAASTKLVVGQSTTLTATTSWSASGATPTGTTTFYANGQAIATVPVDASGVATYSYSPTAPGSVSVTASYNGDAAIGASALSSPLTLDVASKDTTRITTSFTPGTPSAGASVQLSATVVPGSATSGTPSGLVSFYLNSVSAQNLLCSGTLSKGAATCSTTGLAAGTDSVVASYVGDSSHLGSTATFAVPVAKAVSVTAVTVSPSPAQSGQPVTLSAKVSGDQPTGTVSFTTGSTALCSATLASDGTASCTTTALPVGNNDTVTGTYSGDDNNRASSGAASVSVSASVPNYQCSSFGGLWGFSSQQTNGSDNGPTCEPWLLSNPNPVQALTLASGTGGTLSITYSDESALASGASAPSAALASTSGTYLQGLPVTVTPEATYFGRQHDLLSVAVPASLAIGDYEVVLTAFDSDGDVDQNTWSVIVTSTSVPPSTDCSSGGVSDDEHGAHRNQSHCEAMLFNPSTPGGLVVSAGSSGSVSITYRNETALASGAGAPSAVITDASGSVLATPGVAVAPSSGRGDGRQNQDLLSITVPTTLAAGNDVIQLTVSDQEGDVDQYDWPLVVVSSTDPGWSGPRWGAPAHVGGF